MEPIEKPKSLRGEQRVVCGVSTRILGSMRFNSHKKEVLKNRQKFLKELNIAGRGFLARAQLVHGNHVKLIKGEHIKDVNRFYKEVKIKNCDGLITDDKNLWLAVTGADCLPIFFWGKKEGEIIAAGVVHAGWRGVLDRISKKAVEKIKSVFNIDSRNIHSYIGPSIGPDHFKVQADVFSSFQKKFSKEGICIEKEGRKYVNLWQASIENMRGEGVLKKNIEVPEICTVCENKRFFSRRGGDDKEAQMALIGLLKQED